MANINAARVLTFILMVMLSTFVSFGQETQPAGDGDTGNAASAAAVLRAQALSDSAPNPPSVKCKGDQLTISANNSTLSSVLAAVHTCTGVQFDIPDGAMGSRVFDQLGPGPARQVLTALLGATDFNFVIGSSDANPEKIDTVLLMARAGDGPSAVAIPTDRNLTAARRAWLQSRQIGRGSPVADEDGSPVLEAPAVAVSDESSATPVDSTGGTDTSQAPSNNPAPAPAEGISASNGAPTAPAVEANPSTSAPKSTEDGITSMQQLFEQRRQMIQSQNSTKPQ